MKTIEVVIWVILIFLVFLFVVSLIMSSLSNNTCEMICNQKGALTYQIIPSGDWKLNDVCCCIFPAKIESERMG